MVRSIFFRPYPPQLKYLASSLLRTKARQWSAVVTWAAILLVLSLLPAGRIPRIDLLDDLLSIDKWVHALVYGVFAVLLYLPLRNGRIFGGLWAFLLSSVFGAAMEWLQYVSNTGRNFDLADMIANCFGALIGYLLIRRYTKNKRNE
ncbi:hypothetical protein CEQ90_03510 [Lewinellaceae bacterium SD302]|nr:hypothetical protein CEQ90_03510 [Lewinellaceae bacterium SD302]